MNINVTTADNYREYRTVDKSDWASGAWKDEPDKAQWIDPATGLDCLIVRNHFGALCGYVGVSDSHPWHGRPYSDVDTDIDAHGGLTFADACQLGSEDAAICHVPAPGRSDHVWWFGFDCAHGFDIAPAPRVFSRDDPNEVYRDFSYVVGEVTRLAAQIAAVTR